MLFWRYKTERLRDLCNQLRMLDQPDIPGNKVSGLLDLLRAANYPKTVLEIGSSRGISTEVFLLHCARVVVVDPWLDQDTYDAFLQRCGSYPNLEIIQGQSPEGIQYLPNHSFDLIYIDGDHSYESVVKDIKIAEQLVKPSGFVSGHDIDLSGVQKAVREFCQDCATFSDMSWLVKCPEHY